MFKLKKHLIWIFDWKLAFILVGEKNVTLTFRKIHLK